MSITLVCGDVHGRTEVVHALRKYAYENNTPVCFVGDIIDSYDRTVEDDIECMNLVLDLADDGLATLIYGNHELSYLRPHMACSRYNTTMADWITQNKSRIEKTFVTHKWVGQYLVTHAGLGQQHFVLSGASDVMDYLHNCIDAQDDIGYCRGGTASYGGIYWNDYRYEFVPIPNVKQIFGHTKVDTISQKYHGNYCIDCLGKTNAVLSVDTYMNKTTIMAIDLENPNA